jgi:O-antigen ligase
MDKLQRLLLGLIVLEIPIQVDIHLFFQERWADLGAIGGINVSIATICLAALYARWLVQRACSPRSLVAQPLFVSLPATLYVGMAALSVFFAVDQSLAVNGIALLVQAYLLYVYVANQVNTKADVVFLVAMSLIALLMQGAIMVALLMIGHDVELGPVLGTLSPDQRCGGTIGSPDTAGGYLEILIVPALAVLATPLARRYKLLAVSAVGLGGLGLLLTYSRGGWIAVALSVVIFLVFAWYRRWISAWLPITLALCALLVGGLFQERVAARLAGDETNALRGRIPLIQLAWQIICDHPVTGVGINNDALVTDQYAALPQFRGEWLYMVHNKYLLEWAELGLFGLAVFVWFLVSTLRAGWRVWQSQDALLAPLALGLAAAILGQMIHMLFDIFNSRPQIQSLWLYAVLLMAMSRLEDRP